MASSPGPRRAFLKKVLAAGAALGASGGFPGKVRARTPQATGVTALDHVAIPVSNVDGMVAFYRALGFTVQEGGQIVSIHFGDQKINFHKPALWQTETFTLKASAARPPCGDFCWVWEGSAQALSELLARAGAEVVAEGQRTGGRDGGRATGQSVYTRDPDGNLLEFIRYA
ncbi:MAG: twin-arginine translocation signal domain-containing protein [Gemmatimonadota bacterium]|nr:twin-arginine translocation signal domain-containing protein [Gemmatimonadota bacterium]